MNGRIPPGADRNRRPPARSVNRTALTLCAMLLAGISACYEMSAPLQPENPPPPTSINHDFALEPFSSGLSVTAGSLTLPTYDFPEGVLVEIKIEDNVGVNSDSRAPYVNAPTLSLDAKGIWVGGVYNHCYVAAYVSYPTSPGYRTSFGPGNGCTYPRTMQNYVDTGLVRGQGTAIRDAKVPEEHVPCDTIVCHTYSGSQLVTIRPLAAKLDFEGTYANTRSHALFVPRFVDALGYTVTGYAQIVFTDSTISRGFPRANLGHMTTIAKKPSGTNTAAISGPISFTPSAVARKRRNDESNSCTFA